MFDQVTARIAGRSGRVEPRAGARAYLLGLLSKAERKNCWQLAEQAGHVRAGPLQRLLRYARWDTDAVRDGLRADVVEHLGTDGGVPIVDETGFVNKGRASAGCSGGTPAPPGASRTPGSRSSSFGPRIHQRPGCCTGPPAPDVPAANYTPHDASGQAR
ncbi:transposase [Streptomyces sp. TG1A-8]|uniref:transposase n=1 Tax=Streptomyces sp. TG1A-8 TaxID=3051385 RepID=UPI00265C6C9A|nr:transposase [Streptomyces sp. TG1A-8]MDO0929567.1 transposase [Streptomyces sp. TG1A-8]